jgi:sugar phosphate isomerase/epimerase
VNVITDRLAVQSYCFRGFKDGAAVARMTRQIGVAAVELFTGHADFDQPQAFDTVIETYRGAGVEIVSIGVERIGTDETKARRRFEFLRRCGVALMSVDFSPDDAPRCYLLAESLADEYDVRLAIHNHGGRHWLGSAQMLGHVLARTSPRIGLCLDTAWALDAGEDPVEMVKRFGDRLYAVHVKDFVFDRARRPRDAVIGTGNLDLSALCDALHEVKFDGPAILEYEGDVDDPVPALRQCVEVVQREATRSPSARG